MGQLIHSHLSEFFFFQIFPSLSRVNRGREGEGSNHERFSQTLSSAPLHPLHTALQQVHSNNGVFEALQPNISAVQLSPNPTQPEVGNTGKLCSATLQSFLPALNFPELKTGDKLYFGRGPDAENENCKRKFPV